MFSFRRKPYSMEGFEKATGEQKEASQGLAATVRETGQFPEEKDDQLELKKARGTYDAANAQLEALTKSAAVEATKFDKQLNALKIEQGNAQIDYENAKDKYEALTIKLENFKRNVLHSTDPEATDLDEKSVVS